MVSPLVRKLARLAAWRVLPAAAAVALVPGLLRPDLALSLALLSAWTLAEGAVEHLPSNAAAVHSPQDRWSRQAVLGAHLAGWWLPCVELALRAPPVRGWAWAAGSALLLAGAALRLSAVRTLGACFTAHVQVLDGQPVCSTGVYARVRHPSYLGLVLLNAGAGVAAGAWTAAAAATAATLAANAYRVSVEEAALVARLGEPYRAYMRRTPRWIPGIAAAVPRGPNPFPPHDREP